MQPWQLNSGYYEAVFLHVWAKFLDETQFNRCVLPLTFMLAYTVQ